MGKLHKSLALTIWTIFLFLLLQFIFFYQYYKDLPALEKEMKHMHQEITHTQERINVLKKSLAEKEQANKSEEHARTVYMMHKKDEKLYKYLDL